MADDTEAPEMGTDADKAQDNAEFTLPGGNILEPYRWEEVFGNGNPVEVELGAGDGGFMLEWAARHPDRNFIALERLLGRYRKIVKRAARRNLTNLRVLRLENAYFIKWLCLPGSIDRLHIMFPDPWPKRRHHKNRLIQLPFLEDVRKALRPGGEVRFTTDHAEYFEWANKVWWQAPGWECAGGWDATGDPRTDFEKAFMEEGREFQRVRWVRAV